MRHFWHLTGKLSAGIHDIGFKNPDTNKYEKVSFTLSENDKVQDLWNLWEKFCKDNNWNPYETTVTNISERDYWKCQCGLM